MIYITGGVVYQWDIGKKVKVDDDIDEVHFSLNNDDEAKTFVPIDCEATIPDDFLQEAGTVKVFTVKNNQTIETKKFQVKQRPRPENYYPTPKVDAHPFVIYPVMSLDQKTVLNLIGITFHGDYKDITEVRIAKYLTTKDPEPNYKEIFKNCISGGYIDEKPVSYYSMNKPNLATEHINYAIYYYRLSIPSNIPQLENMRNCYRFEWIINGKIYRSSIMLILGGNDMYYAYYWHVGDNDNTDDLVYDEQSDIELLCDESDNIELVCSEYSEIGTEFYKIS